ncbi:hypothetical protein BJX68DRAFT_276047 [Aspergillus pseudodeflectus]|uniref:Uncharacterized protein n=1 Tax=Aspergillus pseudodeflectus TaxID=176178 RepID=A0ABR4KBD6_9EURO
MENEKIKWFRNSSMSYREFVQAQKHKNPCLAGLSNFLFDTDSDRRPCRILQLDFSSDAEGTQPDFEHVNPKELQDTVQDGKERRRILIIEDLRRDVIEVLGSAYAIDPVFFASHIHAPFRQMDSQTPNLALLPSRQQGHNFVNFHYHRAVVLKSNVENENRLIRDMNVERKIAVLLPVEMTRLALVQHACSVILCQRKEDGNGWLCVILVDGPISSDYLDVQYENENNKDHELRKRASRITSRLFQDGYEDFIIPSFIDKKSACGEAQLSRTSLLDDLRYYWNRQIPQQFDPSKPTLFTLSVYPLKIIAAEWNSYMAGMSYHLKRHEYALEAFDQRVAELDKLDEELRSLQAWRRRSLASEHKIASIKRFLALYNPQPEHHTGILALNHGARLREDYVYLADTLNDLSRRLQNMLPVVTSLVQISDSRRSLAESANVNRLTSLAIIFAPLSFTTGLFSMDTINGPGGTHFWVFFAVAIPITIVVFFLARPPACILRWISTRGRRSQGASVNV